MSTDDVTQADADAEPQWTVNGQIWTPSDFIEGLQARDRRIDRLEETIERQAGRIDALEAELDEQSHETEAQWEEIETVRERTDLLRRLENTDVTSASEARAAILQHMYRMVRSKDGDDRRYAMTKAKTNEILHNPIEEEGIDPTTLNRWMRTTAENLVGDESICRYEGGEPGRGGREARIILDLRGEDASALPDELPNRRG